VIALRSAGFAVNRLHDETCLLAGSALLAWHILDPVVLAGAGLAGQAPAGGCLSVYPSRPRPVANHDQGHYFATATT